MYILFIFPVAFIAGPSSDPGPSTMSVIQGRRACSQETTDVSSRLCENTAASLCLSRTRHRSVLTRRSGSLTVGVGSTVGTLLGNRRDLHVLHVDQGLFARVAAGSTALSGLLVGGEVEGDEEEQVGAENGHASKGSEFLSGALSGVGGPWEVGRGEVGVGSEVDKACGVISK